MVTGPLSIPRLDFVADVLERHGRLDVEFTDDLSLIRELAAAGEYASMEHYQAASLGDAQAMAAVRSIADLLFEAAARLGPPPGLPDAAVWTVRFLAFAALAGRTAEAVDWLDHNPAVLRGSADLSWGGRVVVELSAVWVGLLADASPVAAMAAEPFLAAIAAARPSAEANYLAEHAASRPAARQALIALYDWAHATTDTAAARLGAELAPDCQPLIHLQAALVSIGELDLDLSLVLAWLALVSAAAPTLPSMPDAGVLRLVPAWLVRRPEHNRSARRARRAASSSRRVRATLTEGRQARVPAP